MERRSRDRWATGLLVGAVAFPLAVGLSFALIPTYSSVSVSAGSQGSSIVASDSTTLLDEEGPSVLPVLGLPVLPAAIALVARRRAVTRAAAWLVVVFCVLGLMSIGAFYAPGAVLLFVAARAQRLPDQSPVAAASRQ